MPITGSSESYSTPSFLHSLTIPNMDISTSDFPGTSLVDGHSAGLRPTPELHSYLRLDESLVSAKVNPYGHRSTYYPTPSDPTNDCDQ